MSGKQLGEHLEVLRCCACFLGGSGEFEDIHPLRMVLDSCSDTSDDLL